MVKKVSISGMGREVREFFQRLAVEGDSYLVVEDGGKPVAGIVPPWQVDRLETQREELLAMLREVWDRNSEASPEEIEREVAEVVRLVREESS